MTEGLRKITQQFAAGQIYLLSEQANVIGRGNRPLEVRLQNLDVSELRTQKITWRAQSSSLLLLGYQQHDF
ncbi:UDP-sulfoquinovose synthase [Ktedonobacter racemifer DSM 44963]|uniref:UDP-sulfoquinovose synthase n=1 Tax=Ktedonobacter racemifer DSM 44963 TaxID=485913 RepID=D6TV12_KTERA|nr:hypothetical protein [Ktedonobacter racemifer]EFH85338.1 UDP-sulfoquinovose synthase [Ktedonobacter racemifer DSM 44963]